MKLMLPATPAGGPAHMRSRSSAAAACRLSFVVDSQAFSREIAAARAGHRRYAAKHRYFVTLERRMRMLAPR